MARAILIGKCTGVVSVASTSPASTAHHLRRCSLVGDSLRWRRHSEKALLDEQFACAVRLPCKVGRALVVDGRRKMFGLTAVVAFARIT